MYIAWYTIWVYLRVYTSLPWSSWCILASHGPQGVLPARVPQGVLPARVPQGILASHGPQGVYWPPMVLRVYTDLPCTSGCTPTYRVPQGGYTPLSWSSWWYIHRSHGPQGGICQVSLLGTSWYMPGIPPRYLLVYTPWYTHPGIHSLPGTPRCPPTSRSTPHGEREQADRR